MTRVSLSRRLLTSVFTVLAFTAAACSPVHAASTQFGFGKVDVTPDRPVRLSGYGSRKEPFEGVTQKLFARAVAIKASDGAVCVLANADTIGFPGSVTARIAGRVEKELGVPRARFVLCSTHSHTTPQLEGGLTNILAVPLTDQQAAETSRYTSMLADGVFRAAKTAIDDVAPGKLYHGSGSVGFAVNRRVLNDGKWSGFGVQAGGPVDHSLPILKVVGADRKLRGVVFNYACHCTTHGPRFNQVDGDWAGYAQEYLEDSNPGIVAICTIGCGGDANPEPRDVDLDLAKAHGRAVALEASRIIGSDMEQVAADPVASFGIAKLPTDRPTDQVLKEQLASQRIQNRRHAKFMLDIKRRDGQLPATYPAPLQVWRFGDELTMVFISGEVVVDYALRLKREITPGSVWVSAYANDVFGYLASERMRSEGGYEVDHSMIYYNLPGRWSSGTEDIVIKRIHALRKSP